MCTGYLYFSSENIFKSTIINFSGPLKYKFYDKGFKNSILEIKKS